MLLDASSLGDLMDRTDVVYCPMLMDAGELPECDLILVDGAVRLEEEEETLLQARARCRFLAAWGTCSAFGGIPALANRFEVEDLLEEAYGQTSDAYAYYLSGTGGLSKGSYQAGDMALLRRAYKIDDFVRVDAYLPGCPPEPGLVHRLLRELAGEPVQEPRAIVCAECGRKIAGAKVEAVRMFPGAVDATTCLASQGVFCLGVITRGGCGGPCPRNGLPCWGCRGPARTAVKKMEEGASFEEVAVETLSKRCKMEAEAIRATMKTLKRQCHTMFDFESNLTRKASRLR
jgi:F420-non-reducing hydrogenase small subunit